eukprot:7838725-Karenia_brevis.AAC.1
MCCQMYHGQVDDKKYFLHEHPDTTRSWEKACVQGVLARDGVYWIRSDQCESGMTVGIDGVEYPARKTTGWMTNSREVANELAKFQCRNRTTKWT